MGSSSDSESAGEMYRDSTSSSLLRVEAMAELAAGVNLNGRRGLRYRSGRECNRPPRAANAACAPLAWRAE
eukprot:6186539-Lingulodinium_polyedra.AAC.1